MGIFRFTKIIILLFVCFNCLGQNEYTVLEYPIDSVSLILEKEPNRIILITPDAAMYLDAKDVKDNPILFGKKEQLIFYGNDSTVIYFEDKKILIK